MNAQTKKQPVKTELFASKAPLEWAIVNNGTLYTAQIPIDDTGVVVEGGIEAQTRQTFNNLKHTLECAGESLDSVLQVLIYVTDREYLKQLTQSMRSILKRHTQIEQRWSWQVSQEKRC
mgnify:CR=1 FL=1